jgi:hypothetical protein
MALAPDEQYTVYEVEGEVEEPLTPEEADILDYSDVDDPDAYV